MVDLRRQGATTETLKVIWGLLGREIRQTSGGQFIGVYRALDAGLNRLAVEVQQPRPDHGQLREAKAKLALVKPAICGHSCSAEWSGQETQLHDRGPVVPSNEWRREGLEGAAALTARLVVADECIPRTTPGANSPKSGIWKRQPVPGADRV
jgi:hypothetical protein